MAKALRMAYPVTANDLKRFMAHVRQRKNGCWEWTGASTGWGYGQIYIARKLRAAHRVSYEIFIGEIPKGHVVDHLCGNKACVNPAHVEAVTQGENVRRDSPSGKRHYNGAKTHCKWGHPLSGRNLSRYMGADGKLHRRCRACSAETQREYRMKKRAARSAGAKGVKSVKSEKGAKGVKGGKGARFARG